MCCKKFLSTWIASGPEKDISYIELYKFYSLNKKLPINNIHIRKSGGQVWWHPPVIPALGR
jgi:hypothetical protein